MLVAKSQDGMKVRLTKKFAESTGSICSAGALARRSICAV